MEKRLLTLTSALLVAGSILAQSWPVPKPEAKPGARWWWMGSAVNETDLKWNMQEYAKTGIGALEITPIYGVQGNKDNELEFLSEPWMKSLRFVETEGAKDGILIDMNNGTGWPFGGPYVPIEEAAAKLVCTDVNTTGRELRKGVDISVKETKEKPYAKLSRVMAHSAKVNRMAKRALNSKNATTNADGSVTTTMKNWYGRKITRTVSQDASGNYSITNQRSRIKMLGILSHDHAVTTDKYLTVDNKYGKDGKLLKQSFKINSAACKKMTNRDGSLNVLAINVLKQNSTLSPEIVNTAILQQILKERMPNSNLADMDKVFAERSAVLNDDGTFVIKQVNTDGSTTNFSMKINGNSVMTSVERIRTDGSAVKYSSDGIINRRSTYVYQDGKINPSTVKNKYAFSDYYAKRNAKPMDSNGVISRGVPKDKIMFGEDDLNLMAEQIAAYGQPTQLKEFTV